MLGAPKMIFYVDLAICYPLFKHGYTSISNWTWFFGIVVHGLLVQRDIWNLHVPQLPAFYYSKIVFHMSDGKMHFFFIFQSWYVCFVIKDSNLPQAVQTFWLFYEIMIKKHSCENMFSLLRFELLSHRTNKYISFWGTITLRMLQFQMDTEMVIQYDRSRWLHNSFFRSRWRMTQPMSSLSSNCIVSCRPCSKE
jgi:hypothetical protein